MKITLILVCIMLFGVVCFGQQDLNNTNTQKTSTVELVKKLKQLKERRELLKQRKDSLSVKYTEEYIKVIEVTKQIAETERQIDSVNNQIDNSGAAEALELVVLITDLKKRLQLCGYIVPEERCGKEEIKRKLAETYQKAIQNPVVLELLTEDSAEMFEILHLKNHE